MCSPSGTSRNPASTFFTWLLHTFSSTSTSISLPLTRRIVTPNYYEITYSECSPTQRLRRVEESLGSFTSPGGARQSNALCSENEVSDNDGLNKFTAPLPAHLTRGVKSRRQDLGVMWANFFTFPIPFPSPPLPSLPHPIGGGMGEKFCMLTSRSLPFQGRRHGFEGGVKVKISERREKTIYLTPTLYLPGVHQN